MYTNTFNRSKPKPGVYYLGRNDTDHTVTLSLSGARYEYFLRNPTQVETVHQLCRKGLGRRALNYAKLHAYSVLKISATSTS